MGATMEIGLSDRELLGEFLLCLINFDLTSPMTQRDSCVGHRLLIILLSVVGGDGQILFGHASPIRNGNLIPVRWLHCEISTRSETLRWNARGETPPYVLIR